MRRVALNLLLLVAGLLLSALLAELAVRGVVGEQVKFPRHVVGAPFGVRINEPNAHYRHRSPDGTFWFRINGQGMRADRDYPYAKPPGVQRIVSLGDSFTIGYEVAVEECFSSVLEAELRRRGVPVEVLNAGVSGYSNAEALVYLERELFRYDPDLVLISFFTNDLVDNVRSGLFALEGDELVQTGSSYVPAGSLGDFLNTNPLFNFLSAYSDAFALLKERATTLAKRRAVEQNLENVAPRDPGDGGAAEADAGPASDYERRLAAAILERMRRLTLAKGVPLVIQVIPVELPDPPRLVDSFPFDLFDGDREGVTLVAAADALAPHVGREPLYNKRSHFHWTARSHELAGKALAERIVAEGLLEAARKPRPTEQTPEG